VGDPVGFSAGEPVGAAEGYVEGDEEGNTVGSETEDSSDVEIRFPSPTLSPVELEESSLFNTTTIGTTTVTAMITITSTATFTLLQESTFIAAVMMYCM
jgi:hypothetical protein